jgi:hypothetical protein
VIAWTVIASGSALSGQVLAPAAGRRGLFGQCAGGLGLDEATEIPSPSGMPVYLHARGGVTISLTATVAASRVPGGRRLHERHAAGAELAIVYLPVEYRFRARPLACALAGR